MNIFVSDNFNGIKS